MKLLALIVAFAPLVGALVAGLGGRFITRQGAHSVTIFSVLLSFLASGVIFWDVLQGETFNDSLYTFSMLMLVMANNFAQLFFGWEAVGLVSYLLIGFWYTRESAIYASLKAFLVNRVGDFGFLLGIALLLASFGTLDYGAIFAQAPNSDADMTLICILLFIGAMGKSAQFPLHVWLPDSMEGPTPISALIHAAT